MLKDESGKLSTEAAVRPTWWQVTTIFSANFPPEVEIKMGPHKIFMTHGHHYFVSMTLDHLKREARARGADIVIFGHTHKPCLKFEEDMIIMNPGI